MRREHDPRIKRAEDKYIVFEEEVMRAQESVDRTRSVDAARRGGGEEGEEGPKAEIDVQQPAEQQQQLAEPSTSSSGTSTGVVGDIMDHEKQKEIIYNPNTEKKEKKIMNIDDATRRSQWGGPATSGQAASSPTALVSHKKNNDDTGGGVTDSDNSVRNTCWSPGGQLPKDNSVRNTTPNARLPQSSNVQSEKPLVWWKLQGETIGAKEG